MAYSPDYLDFFPATRRGHGRGIRPATKRKPHCVQGTCALNNPKSKDFHSDRAKNIKEWEEERGVKLEDFYNARKILNVLKRAA